MGSTAVGLEEIVQETLQASLRGALCLGKRCNGPTCPIKVVHLISLRLAAIFGVVHQLHLSGSWND